MVFIIKEMHTIEYMENVVNIILNIVTGVGIVIGLGYLKALKDKTYIATFSFWIQFYNRVYELKTWLEEDGDIINNLYSPEVKISWENSLTVTSEKTKAFKERVEELLSLLRQTPDQMPAYVGWTDDYDKLIVFLNDVVKYDICNPKDYFKYCEAVNIQSKKDYLEDKIHTMKQMCDGIKDRQKTVEKRIYRFKW